MRRRRPRRHERKTSERGYGFAHQRERAKYEPSVDAGRECCRRCGRLIPPGGHGPCPAIRRGKRCSKNHRGWDLGHDDFDRSIWTGPEHMCCNRATAGRQRRLAKQVIHMWRRTSRDW